VIGNGTASRESEKIVNDFIKKYKLDVKYMITSESWASVYSASELAQEEYPDLDVTIRGAISIAHRVQDPLAELTKIDPKAIGVGTISTWCRSKISQRKAWWKGRRCGKLRRSWCKYCKLYLVAIYCRT
jgi:protein Tex